MATSILLFGGSSDERLVSVASAQNLASRFAFGELWFIHKSGALHKVAADALAAHARPFELEFEPKQAAFAANLQAALPHLKDRTLFLGLHGTEGEDGKLQSLLEDALVPFTGSGSQSSRLCFDKIQTKARVSSQGIRVAPQMPLFRGPAEDLFKSLTRFQGEHGAIIVKPVSSGSSFGLHIIRDRSELPAASEAISKSSYEAFLAEKLVAGRELTVGVLSQSGRLRVLPPSEVITEQGCSFDYQGKYLGKGTLEVTPAELSETDRLNAQKMALEAHQSLGCSGYSRTDMILSPGGPVFLETNTLPGLSKASFIPQQLAAEGIPIAEFVAEQLKLAEARYSKSSQSQPTYRAHQ